jgi:hypothetical protein
MLKPSCRRRLSPVACSFCGRKNVFTQPGSFATGSSQRQVLPCPLCRRKRSSINHRAGGRGRDGGDGFGAIPVQHVVGEADRTARSLGRRERCRSAMTFPRNGIPSLSYNLGMIRKRSRLSRGKSGVHFPNYALSNAAQLNFLSLHSAGDVIRLPDRERHDG